MEDRKVTAPCPDPGYRDSAAPPPAPAPTWWERNRANIGGGLLFALFIGGTIAAFAAVIIHSSEVADRNAARLEAGCADVCNESGGRVFELSDERCRCLIPGAGIVSYDARWNVVSP